VPGNAGLYLPQPGYLEFLREITRADGALLVFDEVMTGFRLAKGGAQERFGITPDLSCFGKVIGGGLPVGAFGGRAEIMDYLAPVGPVYQAGTLSGNPLAMAAGLAALEELAASNAYAKLEQFGAALEAGMKDAAKSAGVPVQFNRCGSMFCGYFTSEPVHNVAEAMKSDRERFKKYFQGLLEEGIYIAPSQFEAGFMSTAHSQADIAKTVKAAAKVMKTL
jgi:glutamate-1-semialdehyde 2,1-aminomutase